MYKTESFKPDTFKPARFESDGKITLSGKEIPYHTICEDNVIYGPDGNPVASIFTYAYFRSDVEDTLIVLLSLRIMEVLDQVVCMFMQVF